MRNSLVMTTALVSAVMFISFSTNPPDRKTGAPGESSCLECHSQTNTDLRGSVIVEGFPSVITPNETYLLKVINRDSLGTAVRAGFQMTILSNINTKAGEMTNPSVNSAVANFQGRQYFEHRPAVEYPDSINAVEWTVNWTAPDLPNGTVISYYISGNVANGNFQNTGDRIVGDNGNGMIVISSTHVEKENTAVLYPNPGRNQLTIVLPDDASPDGRVIFYTPSGKVAAESRMEKGSVQVPPLTAGLYWTHIITDSATYMTRWIRV